jgi:hypothetical protein
MPNPSYISYVYSCLFQTKFLQEDLQFIHFKKLNNQQSIKN